MVERTRTLIALPLCLSLILAACASGDDDDDDNAGADAAVGNPDAAAGNPDAAPPDIDAAPSFDAVPLTGIAAARAAADGAADILLENVLVTYLKPALGSDVAGFFIQDAQPGPALFIAIDPATLSPVPAVGDDVTLRITSMGTAAQLRQALTITDWAVNSNGNDVGALLQDLTGMTNVSAQINDYESEIVTMTGTVATAFGFAGGGHESAQFDLGGADANFKLRIPATLRDDLDLVQGCNLTLAAVPMWRFNDQAQPSSYDAADITVNSGCPAPEVVSAVALSDTSVKVTFDRHIDPTSVVGDGSQFTITGGAGLTVSAAAVAGRDVTLTTTAQVGAESYTVTVATTVKDTAGADLNAAANTAMFTGFVVLADVRINELNANIASGCDLVELRVISGGSMDGFELYERTGSILTFAGLTVSTNDIIVVHLDGGDTTNCNTATSGNETTAKDELPTGTYPENYDAAWDWYSADTGLTATDNVITLYDNAGAILDAVFASDDPTGSAASASETQAADVAAAGEWQMVGGGIPAGGFVDDDFNAHAAQDLNATGTDTAGESIQRNDNDDNNDKDDWVQAASSWGTINTGQTDL